ncbi:DUF3575 domain-containing protein [Kaistella sp.]|uniref:DUF3575 domain-containing protein n=1 Tax=Kaistella sp. TaxID=2782235 RepID=UPI003C3BD0D2
MKKIAIAFAIIFSFLSNAQNQESTATKSIYIKGNALLLPIGMLNAGVEYQLKEKVTLQADVFVSPWKSFMGNHAQVYMGTVEARYYFKEAFSKFYVGLNLGSAVFDIQKWNYFNTDNYQRGFTILGGATVGYQFKIKENWNIDLYLGGGNSQGFYRGYLKKSGARYDDDGRRWDKSGEWIPYKGGVMISYKLK